MTSSEPVPAHQQANIYVNAAKGAQLESSLSPVALRSSGNGSEPDVYRCRQIAMQATAGSDRLPFERDRDRILHCRQFRKLAGKTQLLIAPNRGDFRTRLTHTMEVYQIATSMGRRLNLNIPAVEAISLGHDVGHTPFGHAGEAALNDLLATVGGFHHAVQSVRSLDHVTYDPQIMEKEHTCGLNLTFAVREGILKHGWFEGRIPSPYHRPPLPTPEWNLAGEGTRRFGSAEAQIVVLADQIAYINHDIDDLLLYGFEKIISKRTVSEFFERHKVPVTEQDRYISWQKAKETVLNLLTEEGTNRVKRFVRDAVDASKERIQRVAQGTQDFNAGRLVEFSPLLQKTRDLFYLFFNECVYTDIRIKNRNDRAKDCIVFLWNFFEKFFEGNPDLLPKHVQEEIAHDTPWWSTYLEQLPNEQGAPSADTSTIRTVRDNEQVACKFAAADVVADLTDREALAAAQALNEAESTAGMEVLDRILATFPNIRQDEIGRQRRDTQRQDLRGLFTGAET